MENWVLGPGAAQIHGKFPASHPQLGFAKPRHCSGIGNGALPLGRVSRLCPEPSRNPLPFHWEVLPLPLQLAW